MEKSFDRIIAENSETPPEVQWVKDKEVPLYTSSDHLFRPEAYKQQVEDYLARVKPRGKKEKSAKE